MDNSNITDELLEKVSAMSEAERRAFLGTLPKKISDQVIEFLAADEIVRQKGLLKPVTGTQDTLESVEEIGPYKLISVLGKGGMGTVFEAQQDKPIKRRVALKLINFGMDSEAVVSRFEAERQALALMNHPNIAQVFDGGTSAKGRPYFVMELVDGVPLDQYCDEKRLTTQQRLELFQLICDAIQHAHQQGIIHRDLKPSNILVTESEDKSIPKVIDFGLAKALHADTTDRTIQTQLNQAMGTLQYMCPEQTQLGSQQIDTRADIYSLGIVLYELLTGSPPLDSDTIKSMALDKVFSLIREKDFVRPSRRLQSSKLSHSISESRSTQSSRLINELTGDLDWIVMKAIEKDRDRRYGSAGEFNADVGRYLSNSVVLARPPSVRYSAGKFIKRNRGLVIAASLIASLLVVSSVVSTTLYLNAEIAKKEALKDRQAAIDARIEVEKGVVTKRKLDEAATVAMARLGDFAMQTQKPAEAAIWFAAAARNSQNLDLPHRLDANLIRLADAVDNAVIPDAAFVTNVTPFVLQPDMTNQYLIASDLDGTSEIWDVEKQKRMMTVRAADWIENGVVVAIEDEIRWYELPSLEITASVKVPGVLDVAVSDDSKWISVCTGSRVKLFQVGEDVLHEKYECKTDATSSCFNAKATHLIVYSSGMTSLLQLPQENGHEPPGIKWSQPSVVMAYATYPLHSRFVGDSTDVLLVGRSQSDLQIRDVNDQQLIDPRSISLGPGRIVAVALDSKGTRLASANFYDTALYDLSIAQVANDKREASLKLLSKKAIIDYVRDMSFDENGSLLVGLMNGFVDITTTTSPNESVNEPIRHQDDLLSLAGSTDEGVIFTAQQDGLIRRWKRGARKSDLEPLKAIPWNPGYAMAESANRKYFVPIRPNGFLGPEHKVQVFNHDGTPASRPLQMVDWYQYADFDQDPGQLWVATSSGRSADHLPDTRNLPGSIQLLDWKTGESKKVIRFEQSPIAVKRIGKFLVVMLPRELVWFDLESESIKSRVPVGDDWSGVGNRLMEVSRSRKMIGCFGTTDGIRVFTENGKLLHHLGKQRTWTSGTFSKDEKRFVACEVLGDHQHQVCIWELESGKMVQAFTHPDTVFSTSFSPDEEYLVTACRDRKARVFDCESGELIGVANHNEEVFDAHFIGGKDLIITSTLDGFCRVWEWRSGTPVTSQPVGILNDAIYQIDIHEDFVRLFGKSESSLMFELPRRENPDLIEFYQWCTGRKWNSIDQSPEVLTSNQWMELWHKHSKNELQNHAEQTPDNEVHLAESLQHLKEKFESADAFRHYVSVVATLEKNNPVFSSSEMVPGFRDGKVISLEFKVRLPKDLSAIAGLEDLKQLDFRYCRYDGGFADITFVKDIANLETFYFHQPIKDLSPLHRLPLKTVDIWNWHSSDLTPLADLKLTRLNIGGAPVSDLTPLKGMPLQDLCINSTDVSDLSPLQGMPLKHLGLANTKVTDLSPLNGIQIETLAINAGTKIRDLDQIRQFPLKALHIDEPEKHRELINSLPNLQSLNHKPIAEFRKGN